MNVCLICNQEISERSHFFKSHKIKEKDYYEKYHPKYDLYNKEKIEFKSPDSYFLTDFNDRRNLRKYLESNIPEKGILYLADWLERRKKLKELKYAMSEFECKSLCFPSIEYIESHFGIETYNTLIKTSDLIPLFDYNQSIELIEKELNFICDSREQSILKLPNMQIATLNYGDYTIENNNGIFIERKSLADAISTLSGGYERFTKEIQRCRDDNSYLIILIEEKYSNLQGFEYMPHIRSKCNWTFISHRIRELLHEYALNIQFIAVDGRKEAVRVIKNIFQLKNNVRKTDLQYLYNKEIL